MKILYTCSSGLSLLKMGMSFGAWGPEYADPTKEVRLEVPEAAITDSEFEGHGYEVTPAGFDIKYREAE
jgi:hypothetical protein